MYQNQNSGQENYTPPATNGQNIQPYLPSAGPKNPLVDKYFHQIESNWQERAATANIMGKVPPAPSLTRSLEIRKDLEEGLIQRELGKVREEFLIEARKIEEERIAMIKADLNKKYEDQLRETYATVETANKVINIQNAILGKIMEKDKDLLLKVLDDAGITEEDINLLANWKD